MDLVARRAEVLRRPPRTELRPRADGGHRRITVLDPPDARTYRRLVGRVAGTVERSLPSAVVANRLAGQGARPEDWRLEDWRSAHRRWRRAVAPAGRGPRLHLDVADCYGSIRPQVVAETLLGLGAGAPAALIDLLHELAAHGVPGLPVGPEPSAILANAVLARVDRAVTAAEARHVRWVDDLVVGVRSVRHATTVLDAVRFELDGLGLRLQDAKTRLEGGGRAVDVGASGVSERVR